MPKKGRSKKKTSGEVKIKTSKVEKPATSSSSSQQEEKMKQVVGA